MNRMNYLYHSNHRNREEYRLSKNDLRHTIYFDFISKSWGVSLLFALFALPFWINDWFFDPAHALTTLKYRLLASIILLFPSLRYVANLSISVDAAITYACLGLCEVLFLLLTNNLHSGLISGVSTTLYLIMGTLVICPAYPFYINLLGSTFLSLIPLPIVWLILSDSNRFQIIPLIFGVGSLVILLHHRARQNLVESYFQHLKDDDITHANTPDNKILSHLADIEYAYQEHEKRHGSLKTSHSVLRIRMFEDNTEQQHCRMVAELKHQGMSEAIGSSLRSNDSAYPLRKLDFICLLSDLDSEISSIIGERIRKKISERKFGCNGAQQLSINPLMITIDRHEVTSFESFHNLLEKMLKPNGVNEKIPYPPSHKLQEQPVCFNPNQARQAESLIQCRTSD